MVGTIDFTYDAERDLVIARPVWTIATDEDCKVWHKQWSDCLSRFGRKIDCIIMLDDFHVEPQIAAAWGSYRASITNDYFRFTCRVGQDWDLRTTTLTESARHNLPSTQADSVDEAIERILAARRQAGVPEKPDPNAQSQLS
jgi:hypothetical protein